MSDESPDPHVSVSDAARVLQVARSTIYHWIAKGWAPHGRSAGRTVLPRRWVDAELERGRQEMERLRREREHGIDDIPITGGDL